MDTALIVVIAVALLVIAFVISRSRRATEKRREVAGNLRVESTEAETRARRAEAQAEKEREVADSRAARADRIDPDTDTPRRGRRLFNRGGGDESAEAPAETETRA